MSLQAFAVALREDCMYTDALTVMSFFPVASYVTDDTAAGRWRWA